MLSQASLFVTPLRLVAPKCADCKDTGEIVDATSFLRGLPCPCQDVATLSPVSDIALRSVTMLPTVAVGYEPAEYEYTPAGWEAC